MPKILVFAAVMFGFAAGSILRFAVDGRDRRWMYAAMFQVAFGATIIAMWAAYR